MLILVSCSSSPLISLLLWLPMTSGFLLQWLTGKSHPRQRVVMPMLILAELAAGNASNAHGDVWVCHLDIWTQSLEKQSVSLGRAGKKIWPLRKKQFGLWDVFCGYATRGEQRSTISPRFAACTEKPLAIGGHNALLELTSVPAPCECFSLSLTRKKLNQFY